MERLDEGVIITDHRGIIHYYNETQAQIDNLERSFAVGKKVTDIYQLSGDTSLIMLCIKLGRPIRNRTFFYKTQSGKVANTIHSIFPIFRNSRIWGAICFVKDYQILRNTTPVISIPGIKPIKENGTRYTFADIIGHHHDLVRSVNTSRAAADSISPIMLIGETGTGKELFAQSIHNQSARSAKPYVAVNCAAIPESLLEGLLFGTTKGAFTGAMDKPGLLEQANDSTLFLDELLCMPLSLQAKLLRVLQEKKVRRIGSVHEIDLNIKIITSVSKPPRDAIQNNELRIDLFYRVGVVMVKIPPLRERLDDLTDLVSHFLLILNTSMGTNVKTLSKEVTHLFRSYHWPGNIRELEHLLEGALNIIGFDEELSLKYFSAAIDTMDNDPGRATAHPPTNPAPVHSTTKLQQNNDNLPISQRNLPESQSRLERRTLHEALSATNGNVSQASSVLGISRQLLHYKMKKHGIRREHFFLQSR
jgi:arginine utilization regulatory protein